MIDKCIRKYSDSGADSIATGFMCKFEAWGSNNKPRQKIEGFFYDDGNVYVLDAGLVKNGKNIGKNKEFIFTDKEQNIEIDDDFDFWLAEQILNKRKEER